MTLQDKKELSEIIDSYVDRFIAIAKSQGMNTPEEMEEHIDVLTLLVFAHEEEIIDKALNKCKTESDFIHFMAARMRNQLLREAA